MTNSLITNWIIPTCVIAAHAQGVFKEVQKLNGNRFSPKQFTTCEEFQYIYFWGAYFSQWHFISLFSFLQHYMLQYNLKLPNMYAGFLLLNSCKVNSNG